MNTSMQVLGVLLVLLVVVNGHGYERGLEGRYICPQDLPYEINTILSNCSVCDPTYWGVRVDQYVINAGVGGWVTRYAHNDMAYFVPASNNKLLTTATAYYLLGADYTIATPLYISTEGDLCFYGQGDPSIAFSDLESLSQTLKKAGISKVRNVYVDDTFYLGGFLPENWEWSDLVQKWGAIPSPLILDENTITLNLYSTKIGQPVIANWSHPTDAELYELILTATTTDDSELSSIGVDIQPQNISKIYVSGSLPEGSGQWPAFIAAIDPAKRFAALFVEALNSNGVAVQGSASVKPCSQQLNSTWKQVASLTSPKLSDMLNHTLQDSDNLFAETFLLHLGKTKTPSSPTDTTQSLGLEVVQNYLQQFYGFNMSFQQDDGSGLSRHNIVTPDTLISLISSLYFGDKGQTYLTFLPVAGMTGTLADRFVDTPAVGVLHAKTGTLDRVNSLTGFIDHHDNTMPLLTFSIIANNSPDDDSALAVIDEIGVVLSLMRNCNN